jgi:hypothetical protein
MQVHENRGSLWLTSRCRESRGSSGAVTTLKEDTDMVYDITRRSERQAINRWRQQPQIISEHKRSTEGSRIFCCLLRVGESLSSRTPKRARANSDSFGGGTLGFQASFRSAQPHEMQGLRPLGRMRAHLP